MKSSTIIKELHILNNWEILGTIVGRIQSRGKRQRTDCFVYLYPGFIALVIYYFSLGKSLKENKYILIKSVIISYLYIAFIKVILGKSYLKNDKVQNIG